MIKCVDQSARTRRDIMMHKAAEKRDRTANCAEASSSLPVRLQVEISALLSTISFTDISFSRRNYVDTPEANV
jgi:hypothetical protein